LPVRVPAFRNAVPASATLPWVAIRVARPETLKLPVRSIEPADRYAAAPPIVPGMVRPNDPVSISTEPERAVTLPATVSAWASVRVNPLATAKSPSVPTLSVPAKLAVLAALPVSVPALSKPVTEMLPVVATRLATVCAIRLPPRSMDPPDSDTATPETKPGMARPKLPVLRTTEPRLLTSGPVTDRAAALARAKPLGAENAPIAPIEFPGVVTATAAAVPVRVCAVSDIVWLNVP